MKVAYCGGFWNYPWAWDHAGIKQGFDSLEWDWSIVDSTKDNRSGEEIAAEINELNPDIIFHGNADSLGKRICSRVNSNITQVFCMLDYRQPGILVSDDDWYTWMKDIEYCDTVFVSAKNHIPIWKKHCPKVFYAPHACYIPPEGLQYHENFDLDFIFIGGMNKQRSLLERANFIETLASKTRIPLTLINGSGQKERDEIWRQMPLYYHSSKVTLDVSHFWNSPGYSSGRFWYCATLGGCAITKHFPDCEELFPSGTKWYFDTPEEGARLVENLTNNPDIIERTKRAVAQHAWKNHNYHVRFSQMIEMIEKGEQVTI